MTTSWSSLPVVVRPKVICPNKMLSPVNVDGAKLTCIVRANPGVNDLVWSWQRVSGAVMTLREGQTENHYSITVEDGVIKLGPNNLLAATIF